MSNTSINKEIVNARRWSLFTEIVSKLITPITNMVLARLISPVAFGIVTTATMIFSFGDIFSTGGFPNYIIHKQFNNKEYEDKAINIAFTSNFVISVFIWVLIIIFQNQITTLVGLQHYNYVIVISCFQLVITAFSSIQLAILKKRLEFKKLFYLRIITSFVPFLVSIPLAFLGWSYWSIIITNLLKEIIIVLYLKKSSNIHLSFDFDYVIFRKMFNFCIWSLIESIIIWFCTWIDSIIIGSLFTQYEVGLWKTSATMLNGLFGIVKSITIPVLFSSLCILQNDEEAYNHQIHLTRRIIALIMFPISIGIIILNELAVFITLGDQWKDANLIFISKTLLAPLVYTIPYVASEIYRSKGQPKISAVVQFIHVLIFIPLAILFAKNGFSFYVQMYPLFDAIFIVINLCCLKYFYSTSILNIFKDLFLPFIYSVIMAIVILGLKQVINQSIFGQFSLIVLGGGTYLLMVLLTKFTRKSLIEFFVNKK